MKFKSSLLGIITVAVSLMVGLLLVETAVRWLLPTFQWKAFHDLDLGWASDEYLSFDPLADKIIKGQKRNLVIGDSYLAGSGVTDRNDHFPMVMQHQLGNSTIIKILAIGGCGTDQKLLAFLQKGIAWKPDLVLVAFTAHNDIRNNLSNYGRMAPKPYFLADNDTLTLYDHEGYTIPFPEQSLNTYIPLRSHALDIISHGFLKQNSERDESKSNYKNVDPRYLLVKNQKEYQNEITQLQPELDGSPQEGLSNVSVYLSGSHTPLNHAWSLFKNIMARFKQEVQNTGASFLLVVLPDTIKPQDSRFITGSSFTHDYETPGGQIHLNMSEPIKRIEVIAGNLGIEVFDPTADFIWYIEADNLVKACWPDPNDNHFSKVGHDIIAKMTLHYLQNYGHLK